MQFNEYVPAMKPIGIDLKLTLGSARHLLFSTQTTKTLATPYPPFANILLMPLLSVKQGFVYRITTIATLVFYLLITYVLPYLTNSKRRLSGLLALVLVSGLFSYGLQFELERGQFNVIAFAFCFLAIWIFHYHYKFRVFAYILFTISVQLKLYPLIFIIMFVKDWRDWKINLMRFLGLISLNIALLFVFGYTIFLDFIHTITNMSSKPYIWIGNHSILAITRLASNYSSEHGWEWISNISGTIQLFLLAVVGACILIILFQGYRNNRIGIDPYLLLACTIGALMISIHKSRLQIVHPGRSYGNPVP